MFPAPASRRPSPHRLQGRREDGTVRQSIEKRILEEAAWLIDTGATIRACATKYGVSKTTAHKDMRRRLPHLDAALARRVARVLGEHLKERHLRGGEATKLKYAAKKENRPSAANRDK